MPFFLDAQIASRSGDYHYKNNKLILSIVLAKLRNVWLNRQPAYNLIKPTLLRNLLVTFDFLLLLKEREV